MMSAESAALMLDGKVAVMTGGGQGLGLAYALAFAGRRCDGRAQRRRPRAR